MTESTLVLDSEAVSALAWGASTKRRAVAALVEGERGRHRRRDRRSVVVPSTVRVEAGWDRTASRWAVVNRLGIDDHHLDRSSTDLAARLRSEHGVAPADAHIGALTAERVGRGHRVVVVTSDPADIAVVTAGTGARVVRL